MESMKIPRHLARPSRWPRPIAFVFSGGSSLGALHPGMLRADHEAGIEPDFLVGTSVGALDAAFIANGFTSSRVSELTDICAAIEPRTSFQASAAERTSTRSLRSA